MYRAINDSSSVKLTPEKVMSLPELLKTKTKREIAKEWGVAPTTITEITSGRSWRHLGVFEPNPRTSDKYFNKTRYVPTTAEKPDLVGSY